MCIFTCGYNTTTICCSSLLAQKQILNTKETDKNTAKAKITAALVMRTFTVKSSLPFSLEWGCAM